MVSHWKFQPAFKGRQEKLTDIFMFTAEDVVID